MINGVLSLLEAVYIVWDSDPSYYDLRVVYFSKPFVSGYIFRTFSGLEIQTALLRKEEVSHYP